MKSAVAIAIVATAASAAAEPQLRLTREPPPRHLRMRPRAAAAPARPAPAPAPPMPAAPPGLTQSALEDRDGVTALRDVREPVSFSLTLGYQVDAALPSGKSSLATPVQEGRDYRALRSYGFGELFFSTRGVVLDSLSSYFSLRLDAAQRAADIVPATDSAARIAPPITTWFDRTTFEVRTGWGEVKEFLGVRKLRLRAGSQYIYGPWVMHIDGALLAYEGDIVTATGYAGGRHADYTVDIANEQYAVAGASLRVDLRKLAALPITIAGETLSVSSGANDQPSSTHRQFALDWAPRRDFTVRVQARTLDDKIASERLELRARYREVTNLVIDVTRRLDTDWRWDPALVVADDPTQARRYLDLGPVLPQVMISLRAGTLIAENVDLLVRTTIARDRSADDAPKSSFSAAYVEVGGALDIRLRRTLSLGISALTRQTDRDDAGDPMTDIHLVPQPLVASATTGEQQLTEVGVRARLSLGSRRLSALLELYGRRTRYPEAYIDPLNEIDPVDSRGGGRISIDAWISKRLRLFGSYDLSTAIERAPEITSYKSLRLTMTGVY